MTILGADLPDYHPILQFWFEEIEPSQWWAKDAKVDRMLASRFAEIHQQAAGCELYGWRRCAEGRLAEIIVLDQFSRNLFRDTPQAYAYDAQALVLAQEAISVGADRELSATQRSFLYMPFMHSESLTIHEVAVALFSSNGIENNLDFELKHKKIIDLFGRYPHRNAILGRTSTPAEIEFLKAPDSTF